MEDQSPTSPVEDISQNEDVSNQPGAQAVEALVRAIAQEFVFAFDELHESLLRDDEVGELPRVQAAGS